MKAHLTADPINWTCLKCNSMCEGLVDNGYDHVDQFDDKQVISAFNKMLCHNCNEEYIIRIEITRKVQFYGSI